MSSVVFSASIQTHVIQADAAETGKRHHKGQRAEGRQTPCQEVEGPHAYVIAVRTPCKTEFRVRRQSQHAVT